MPKSPHDRNNINFTFHDVYFIMHWLYLCILFTTVIHLYILYGINLNGKMGVPHAYFYENSRTTYRRMTSRKAFYAYSKDI